MDNFAVVKYLILIKELLLKKRDCLKKNQKKAECSTYKEEA